jgi:hypothetical protein
MYFSNTWNLIEGNKWEVQINGGSEEEEISITIKDI